LGKVPLGDRDLLHLDPLDLGPTDNFEGIPGYHDPVVREAVYGRLASHEVLVIHPENAAITGRLVAIAVIQLDLVDAEIMDHVGVLGAVLTKKAVFRVGVIKTSNSLT
jgi:hypothetical protein